MYNNGQISKAELLKLTRELEETKITLNKLKELDADKKVFCAYGNFSSGHLP